MGKKNLAQPHKVHKYRRVIFKPSGRIAYKCAKPGCPHYLYEEMAEGAVSECNRGCGREVILNKKMIARRTLKPHCEECTRPTFNKKFGKVVDHRKLGTSHSLEEVQTKLDDILADLLDK